MDDQKLQWLAQIGVKKLPEPVPRLGKEFNYVVTYPDGTEMHFSEQYLRDTPLEALKKRAQRFGVAADG